MIWPEKNYTSIKINVFNCWSFMATSGHIQTVAVKGFSTNSLGAGDENRTRVLSLGS
jgi:hypothetical protein